MVVRVYLKLQDYIIANVGNVYTYSRKTYKLTIRYSTNQAFAQS